MSRNAALKNILDTLSDTQSVERNGSTLKGVASQLNYAGVKVTVEQLREALDDACESCPSTFLPMPEASSHYGPNGTEYRLRRPEALRQARACIDRVYEVTDELDRTLVELFPAERNRGTQRSPFGPFGGPMPKPLRLPIEIIRPRAFAICMGYLRKRWAKGNFAVPNKGTVNRWFENHPAFEEALNQAA